MTGGIANREDAFIGRARVPIEVVPGYSSPQPAVPVALPEDDRGGLPEDDRDLLHLKFVAGLSPAEIAQELGIGRRACERELRSVVSEVAEVIELEQGLRFCETRRALLIEHAVGTAGSKERAADTHLGYCDRCRDTMAALEALASSAALAPPAWEDDLEPDRGDHPAPVGTHLPVAEARPPVPPTPSVDEVVAQLKTRLSRTTQDLLHLRFARNLHADEIQRELEISRPAYERELACAIVDIVENLGTFQAGRFCEPDLGVLLDYVAEIARPSEAHAASIHLSQCQDCWRMVGDLHSLATKVAAALGPEQGGKAKDTPSASGRSGLPSAS